MNAKDRFVVEVMKGCTAAVSYSSALWVSALSQSKKKSSVAVTGERVNCEATYLHMAWR